MVSKRLPKISVITPSYNTGKYIEATIKSIINQQYNNIEHIIFDGNSQDNTVDILKQYSHLKWISEPDSGQSSALNKGFKLAKGKYIVWLNSDDILTEGSLYRSIKIDILVSKVINSSSSKSRSFSFPRCLTAALTDCFIFL